MTAPVPGSRCVVIWLPWHDWQLAKREYVPRILAGGQSPQSASDMSAVIGTQPLSARVPVLQNHSPSGGE